MKSTAFTSISMRSRSFVAVATAALAVAGCNTLRPGGASSALDDLFAEDWEARLRASPLFATHVGDHRANDRLPEVGESHSLRRLAEERRFLARVRAIDRAALDPQRQIHRDIFERLKEDSIAGYEFRTYLMPITNRSGFHVSFPDLPDNVPLRSRQDYENYIARLAAFARYADQHIEVMRQGIAEGYVLPAVVLEGVEGSIEPHIVADPTRSLLFRPFAVFPESVAAADRDRLRRAGVEAIRDSVVAGYRRFLKFLQEEYVPAARREIGASTLPNGKAFYEHRVRRFTTLDVTPEEVHAVGLAEVERIRKEMAAVIESTGFDGDFAAFLDFLRTDARFYVDDPDQLLKEVAWILKRMDGKLPQLFRKLPRTPYGLTPIPDFIAPKTTSAYYRQPAGDGTRGGTYFLNTYDLASRPLYEMEALSLHEAVPGHHLQLALQQELDDMPEFRRFEGFTAFVEGWALYAERLGLEVGFYADPYSDFGRLTYEMWRACRLVVDTGMHYLGWSRQRAIDFMARNTALTLHNITTEVDRYISWPGQALAYKMGELKIRELRARAEAELGSAFDVRDFHDVVLRSGAVPLTVLEASVDDYIRAAGRRSPAAAIP